MGTAVFDQYSLLHVASGVVAYFWGVSFAVWMLAHVAFEAFENTPAGMAFINGFPLWPGGKPAPDSFRNSMIGDNLCAAAGWALAYGLDTWMTR